MFIIKYRKIFIAISASIVLVALALIAIFGLKPGIDFKGGSALTYTYNEARPELEVIQSSLANAGYAGVLAQPVGERGIQVKSDELSDNERAEVVSALTIGGIHQGTQESFTTIGPTVGKELRNKAIISITLVLIFIVIFVSYVFRKVSEPVQSWKYAVAVIIALIHDILIPTGIFALLGKLIGAEIDTLFIVALLTTLALSVSDTIVVFDRVRENLKNLKENEEEKSFDVVVGESLDQTFARSINTSLMVLFMLLSLAILGPDSTRLFSIVLALGMFFGIYSSVFLASPLLVVMEKLQKKKE